MKGTIVEDVEWQEITACSSFDENKNEDNKKSSARLLIWMYHLHKEKISKLFCFVQTNMQNLQRFLNFHVSISNLERYKFLIDESQKLPKTINLL